MRRGLSRHLKTPLARRLRLRCTLNPACDGGAGPAFGGRMVDPPTQYNTRSSCALDRVAKAPVQDDPRGPESSCMPRSRAAVISRLHGMRAKPRSTPKP